MYVVQMIDGLSVGGAQQLQLTFARQASRRGIKLSVISLSEDDGSGYSQQLQSLGVSVHFFPMQRLFDLGMLFGIAKWLRRERPDVIHTHLTYSNIIGSLLGRICAIPSVTTLHSVGFDFRFQASRTIKAEIVALKVGLNRLIACGPEVERHFKTIVPRREILIIPNAIDYISHEVINEYDRISFRREIDVDGASLIIISVGRLTYQKGFHDLIDAFSIVRSSHPSAVLALAGGGGYRDELEKKITSLNLQEHVVLLGERKDIARLLSVSDIFVLASHWEGLPISILEAMAAGLPVVVTNVGDISWAVGSAGIVVPPKDHMALATSLISLLDDSSLRRYLGQAGRTRIEEHFDPVIWFDKIISVYQTMLD